MTGTPEIVHHYDAATARRGFFHHALPLHRYVRDAWAARTLVWNFYRRELLGRFRGSAGGFGWVMIQPVFQFIVYFAVFGILFAPRDQLREHGPDPLFALYLFAGIVMFNAVNEGSSNALLSVIGSANLVKKVAFPCELLPLTPILVSAGVYGVGCVVLLLIGLVTGQVSLGLNLLAWPLLLVCMVVFATGLGLLLAGANVFARDVGHLWGIWSQAWFFLSPVFWRMPMIRDKVDDLGVPWAIHLLVINPMYSLLLAQRQVFGIGTNLPPEEYEAYFPLNLGENLMVSAAWALFMLFIGYGFFMCNKRKFADLV